MFSLFKRKPQFQDIAFKDLSEMLTQEVDNPIYRRGLLALHTFDYSINSLKYIDEYLESIRKDELQSDDIIKIVLRCGAYVGEVIRHHSKREYHWLSFEDAARQSKYVKDLEMGWGTVAILWSPPDNICFPLAKIGKYLENGSEDSVYFFARVMIDGIPKS